ncbi:MAG: TetR/AcrR family transcriptional regulator [Chloroflexota bacterium]
MARKKAFNPDKAVELSMNLFWLKGYTSTSVSELCEAMHIKPGSLYDTFGSKRALFLKALEHYKQQSGPVDVDEASHTVLDIVAAIFEDIVDEVVNDEQHRGCFMLNTITELAATDTEIAELGRRHFQMMEDVFHTLLVRAQRDGEITGVQSPRALAKTLTNTVFGLRVVSKINPTRQHLEDIVSGTMSALK